jgi:hypothetical protein
MTLPKTLIGVLYWSAGSGGGVANGSSTIPSPGHDEAIPPPELPVGRIEKHDGLPGIWVGVDGRRLLLTLGSRPRKSRDHRGDRRHLDVRSGA